MKDETKNVGRKKGVPNKNGYKLTADAYHQRVMASHSRKDVNPKNGTLYKALISRQDLDEEQQEILAEEKIQIWKKFNTPILMMMDEFAQMKMLISSKLLKGTDPTSKDIIAAQKLQLEIMKEINRYSQVSADKAVDVFAKQAYKDDFELDIESEDVTRSTD